MVLPLPPKAEMIAFACLLGTCLLICPFSFQTKHERRKYNVIIIAMDSMGGWVPFYFIITPSVVFSIGTVLCYGTRLYVRTVRTDDNNNNIII